MGGIADEGVLLNEGALETLQDTLDGVGERGEFGVVRALAGGRNARSRPKRWRRARPAGARATDRDGAARRSAGR